MKVPVEAYGYVGTLLEAGPRVVDVPDEGATVGDVERALIRAVPELADSAEGLAYAVGAEAVARDRRLSEGEAVVVLSPVSGG